MIFRLFFFVLFCLGFVSSLRDDTHSSRSFTTCVNETDIEKFDSVISKCVLDEILVSKFNEKRQTLIPMAKRGTQMDLANLEEYMQALGVVDTILRLDVQEELLKVYESGQEHPPGMFVLS